MILQTRTRISLTKATPPPISHHSIILNELSNGLKLSQLSAAEALGEREYVQGSPRK